MPLSEDDEELIVVALLHDIGEAMDPSNHGEVAAEILRPFISKRNHWVLMNHELFQLIYFMPAVEGTESCSQLAQLRSSPHFSLLEKFCLKWDQASYEKGYQSLPLEFFVPMVNRVMVSSGSTAAHAVDHAHCILEQEYQQVHREALAPPPHVRHPSAQILRRTIPSSPTTGGEPCGPPAAEEAHRSEDVHDFIEAALEMRSGRAVELEAAHQTILGLSALVGTLRSEVLDLRTQLHAARMYPRGADVQLELQGTVMLPSSPQPYLLAGRGAGEFWLERCRMGGSLPPQLKNAAERMRAKLALEWFDAMASREEQALILTSVEELSEEDDPLLKVAEELQGLIIEWFSEAFGRADLPQPRTRKLLVNSVEGHIRALKKKGVVVTADAEVFAHWRKWKNAASRAHGMHPRDTGDIAGRLSKRHCT